ncbi:MAG: sigma-70 family RNA polymerase sigma factor, partial [Planctomycetota bacterium]
MTPEQPSVRLDELLAHAGWVRGLAGSLVRDPAAADDLAQETLVAAWKRPPSADRPVRPWLAGVVRNLARQWWRGEGRRQRREASAAENERPLPGPDELASRLETQQRLAALVAELDEPLRGTVILRYYESLSSAEIARRQGVPAGTVRWRLKKAMDLLRERLDREHDGDRAAWIALVAPLAEGLGAPPLTGTAPSPAASATAAGVTGGLLAMATTTKLAIGGAVVVLAAVGMMTVSSPDVEDDGAGAAMEVAETDPVDLRGKIAEDPAVVEESADAATAAPEVEATETADAALEPVRLRARFVDEEGRTLAGAWLRSRTKSIALQAKGDSEGVVSIDVTVPEKVCTLYLEAGGLARATTQLAETTVAGANLDLGDITLVPGGTVSGRVVDGNGDAVPDAWVGVSHRDFAAVDAHNGRLRGFDNLVGGAHAFSDAVGVFRLEGAPAGLQRLWAGKDGWRAAPADAVEVRAGEETVDIVVTLGREMPADFVDVRVVDPSGAPVPHADLRFKVKGENFTQSSSNVTDEQGRFRVPLHMPGTVSVSASHPDDTWGPAGEEDIEPSSEEVVLRLVEPRYMSMNVRTPSGEPIMDVMHNVVVD